MSLEKKNIYVYNLIKISIMFFLYMLFVDSNSVELSIRHYPSMSMLINKVSFGVFNSEILNKIIYFSVIALLDMIMLHIVFRLFSNRKKEILYYYILNPIICYSAYFLLEYDLLPLMLMIIGIKMVFNDKFFYAGIMMGFAIASKNPAVFGSLLVGIYIYKTSNHSSKLINCCQYLLSFIGTYLIITLPFILFFNDYFSNVLVSNSLQLMTDTYYLIGNMKIYLLPMMLMMLFFRFSAYKKVNKELLFDYLGIIYLTFVILIQPHANWYLWSMVFIAIIFIRNHEKNRKIIYIYCLILVLYFVNNIEILSNQIYFVEDFLFSAFEAVLVSACYLIYKLGIRSNKIYENKYPSLVIGIGGDSGSGKSTLLKSIKMLLGENKIIEIEADGDHKWERGHENWSEYTHLNPKANFLYKQANYLRQLKLGNDIMRVEYDHETGKFTEPNLVRTNDYILVAGLHPFYLSKSRRLMDIKIYLDTEESVRRHWKVIRDIEHRGYSLDRIINQIESRMPDAKKYIYPQRNFSDIIIKFFSKEKFDIGCKDQPLNIALELKIKADLDLDDIVCSLINAEAKIIHSFDDDLLYQTIILEEPVDTDIIMKIVSNQVENIEELLIESQLKWMEGYHSFIQLVILLMVVDTLKGEAEIEI